MLNNVNTNVERIIAKLDNDFNFDQSDWIPRVGAWVIDAMSQIDALRKVRKRIKLIVNCGYAYAECPINSPNLIVIDSNGCKVDRQRAVTDSECDSSTGKVSKLSPFTPSTIDVVFNRLGSNGPNVIAKPINDFNNPHRYNYVNVENKEPRTYVLVGNNKLELNFDDCHVYAETDCVETEFSDYYGCELPVIPNVGLLIEYVAYFCVYKMLCRGYKHPLFNLAASQYGTNPYYEFNKLKPEAKRSVIIGEQGNINVTDGNLFQSAFFITTFKPRS